MNPRTKTVDTKATNAAEFLTGATPAPILQPPDAAAAASAPAPDPDAAPALAPETVPAPVAPKSTTPPLVGPSGTGSEKPDASPTPNAEKAIAAIVEPDPFLTLWKRADGNASLSAMEVPGGCIVRRAWFVGGQTGAALCFVPAVKVSEGKIVAV